MTNSPNTMEKERFEKIRLEQNKVTYSANCISDLSRIIHGINVGKRKDLVEIDFHNAQYQFNKLKELFDDQQP